MERTVYDWGIVFVICAFMYIIPLHRLFEQRFTPGNVFFPLNLIVFQPH